jgi:hypothetical protein
MMVLATFISICIAAVLFLLRFLFAVESECRAARRVSTARLHSLSTYRIPSGGGAYALAPALALVHSNTGQAFRGYPVFQDALVAREEKSQYKQA